MKNKKRIGVKMEINGNIYDNLRHEDYKQFVETKGNSSFSADYLSWAVAWDKLKKTFPYATYKVKEFVVQSENLRLTLPFMMFPDKSGMVHVEVTIMDKNGDEHRHPEVLAIRDFKMKAAINPDAAQVENTIRRAIAKAVSMLTGFGIELWFGEDIKDLDYRAETLLSGDRPENGGITVDQNIKLDKLSRSNFVTSEDRKVVKDFMNKKPTEKSAENAINKLQEKINKKKEENKNETK